MAEHETETEPTPDEAEDAAEEIEFELPEFDEEEYIRKEIRDAKMAVATLVYAMAAAVATRTLHTTVGNLPLAAVFGLAAAGGMKPVFGYLGIDVTDLDKKKFVGVGAVYFFAWLGFWTLLLNPPFV